MPDLSALTGFNLGVNNLLSTSDLLKQYIPQSQFTGIPGLNQFTNPLLGFGLPVQSMQRPHMPHMIDSIIPPGSAKHAAAFHAKGPDNEIKLFVGGLAF